MWQLFKKFFNNQSGNIALSFALASVALVGVGGGVLDYAAQSSSKSQMQGVADAAVLVAANELKLSGSKASQATTIGSVAKNYVKKNIDKNIRNVSVLVGVSVETGHVNVKVSGYVESSFFALLGINPIQKISANASAKILGGLPLCVLALEQSEKRAISATSTAQLSAAGCSVHANSLSTNAIEVWGNAKLKTGLTCSSGGFAGGQTNFIPSVISDCPPVSDPLASRPDYASGGCNYMNKSYSSGKHTIWPGVYCGGLKITAHAEVEYSPGVYVMKNGKFEVSGKAEAEGEHDGFYFTGLNSFFGFHAQAEVEFSAPATGDLAGMLFFEDPNQTQSYINSITSAKIKSLVGTIYLPKSELQVSVNGAGSGDVAQESAFTVIVARQITLSGKSRLVLNTDFAATDVPVPESISRLSGQIVLTK